jgi:hypothetical protein
MDTIYKIMDKKKRVAGSIILGIALTILLLGSGSMAFAGTSGPSPIPPAPNFQISSSTSILCAGFTNLVPITITNQGNPYNPAMLDVQIGLNSPNTLVIGNSIEIPNIAVNTTSIINVPFFVSPSSASIITVQVPITYNYLELYSDSEVRNVTFSVRQCTTPLAVNVTPTTFESDQIDNLTLRLTNTGATTLRNISIQQSSPNENSHSIRNISTAVQFFGVQPLQINSIRPGNTVLIRQSMFENASGDTFPLNLTLTYYNGAYPEEQLNNFLMLSTGSINMETTSITTSPTNVTAGDIFSISFIITDIGTEGATAVSVTPIFPTGFTTYGSSNSTFVGDVATDTQTPVTLTLISETSLKSGKQLIPIRINYLNNLRQNISTIIDVPVNIVGGTGITAATGGTSNSIAYTRGTYARRASYSLYIEIALVVIVIALAVFFLIERKKTKAMSKTADKQRPKS